MSNSSDQSKNEADDYVSVVSQISSSEEYANWTQSENFGLFMEKSIINIYTDIGGDGLFFRKSRHYMLVI